MAKARPSQEYVAFDKLAKQLLSVPKTVIDARVKEHRERAALNPKKRGPKPKVKPSSADVARDADTAS